jgi:hypothetical protein
MVKEAIRPGRFRTIMEKITNRIFAQKLKNGFSNSTNFMYLAIINVWDELQAR